MKERQMKLIDGSPTAAIYTRKSRATEKGESIEHQIFKCISLCESKGWGYIVYVDYDYSGKDTDRPDFFEMMEKVRKHDFDCMVVYSILRFARNMKDSVVLLDELNTLEVEFVSITQNFDTTTPMGRAGMYMSAVFGQLERENTSEQVKDNMIYLAEKGRWNGGPIPFGFDTYSKLIDYREDEGQKKVTYLTINEEESNTVKEFYTWYLAPSGSVRNVVTRANELGYKTKNGAHWSHSQVSRMLQNALYCMADRDSYEYFKNHTEVNMVDPRDLYNGENGLMYYNRRRQYKKTTRLRDESEWILSIGEHKGFIPGETFASVQLKLSKNKNTAPRSGQSERSPLIGLVKCGRCESSMSVFSSPRDSTNKHKGYYHYFRCLTREQKAKVLCDNSNVRADKLEDLVVSNITGLLNNKQSLKEILEATNKANKNNSVPLLNKENKIKNKLKNVKKELDNLVDALSKNILPELIIKKKYKELEKEQEELRKELNLIGYQLSQNNHDEAFEIDTIFEYVKDFKNTYEYLDLEEKKKLLNSIVKEISMDKNKVKLKLYFLPGQEYDSQVLCSHTDRGSYLQ